MYVMYAKIVKQLHIMYKLINQKKHKSRLTPVKDDRKQTMQVS